MVRSPIISRSPISEIAQSRPHHLQVRFFGPPSAAPPIPLSAHSRSQWRLSGSPKSGHCRSRSIGPPRANSGPLQLRAAGIPFLPGGYLMWRYFNPVKMAFGVDVFDRLPEQLRAVGMRLSPITTHSRLSLPSGSRPRRGAGADCKRHPAQPRHPAAVRAGRPFRCRPQ